MAFQVSGFTADLNDPAKGGGLARANLFTVSITGDPEGVATTLKPGSGRDLLVKAAQFPGSTVAPMPVNYGGRIIKLTGFRTFDNWTISILNDEDFLHRKWIQAWMYAIAGDPDGAREKISRGTLYNAPLDLSVTALNNMGGEISKWNFVNAWPTALGDITLDWSSDAIQEYTVEFAYEYWTHGHNDARVSDSTSTVTESDNVVPAQGTAIAAT